MNRDKMLIMVMFFAALGVSCETRPNPSPSPWSPTSGFDQSQLESFLEKPVPLVDFSGARAWSYLRHFEEIGPRVSGSTGSRRARRYLRGELKGMGLEVRERRLVVDPGEEIEAIELVHVTAVLPGRSSEVFLLGAPYDTRAFDGISFDGANEGASGSAILLELARALSQRGELPYTIWLTWIDGDSLGHGNLEQSLELAGSRSLAADLSRSSELSNVRFALFLGAVGDADLEIARDLRSSWTLREVFWRTAAELGYASSFPGDRGYGTPMIGQIAFVEANLRNVVALTDVDFDGAEVTWHTELDHAGHCSPPSLEIVGKVVLEGMGRVAHRMRKIDEFDASPLSVGLVPPAPLPQP